MKTVILIGAIVSSVLCYSQTTYKIQSAYNITSRSEVKPNYRSIQVQEFVLLKKRGSDDEVTIVETQPLPGGARFRGVLNGTPCTITLMNITENEYTATVDYNSTSVRYYLTKNQQ